MEVTNMTWKKSSYSGNGGGECVEIANTDRVLVRDSKNPEGAKLVFGTDAWQRFTSQVKRSLVDPQPRL
jgi:Domain of unknown function (DUF397)